MSRPVIIYGTNEWIGTWQTRQHVSNGLAQLGYDIAYTVGLFHTWDIGREEWKRAQLFPRWESKQDKVAVFHPGKMLVRYGKLKSLESWVIKKSLKQIRKRFTQRHQDSDVIHYAFSPKFYDYIKEIDSGVVVYHADDNFSKMPGWNAKQESDELKLLDRADLILGSSPGVVKYLQDKTDKQVCLLPNGVNYDLFSLTEVPECPADIKSIDGIKIGYVGELNGKVDFKTIYSVAKAQPSWNWVLIGPSVHHLGFIDEESKKYYEACTKQDNIHFLGEKSYFDLPAYEYYMDINTMCYRTGGNRWWDDIYPLKMHEYLAIGKPVVSSMVDSVKPFSDVIAMADTVPEWIHAIQESIKNNSDEVVKKRNQVARENSWSVRCDQLHAWLASFA